MFDNEDQQQSNFNQTTSSASTPASSSTMDQDDYIPDPVLTAATYDLDSEENNLLAHKLLTDQTVALVNASEMEHQSAAGAAPKEDARAPTSVESSLSNIQITADRQERFVMLGDPDVEKRFYANLAAAGKLEMRGRTPVISLDQKDSLKWYAEAARQLGRENCEVGGAVRITLPRDGSEMGLAGLKNKIKNSLGRQHEVMVVIAGSPEERAKKLVELGSLVSAMWDNKALSQDIPKEQLVDPKTGQLIIPADKPLHLNGTKGLVDLTTMVGAVADAFKRQEQEKDKTRKENRNAREEKSNEDALAKAAGKQPGADAGASVGANGVTVTPKPYAVELAATMSATLADSAAWKVKSPDKYQNMRDPVDRLLQTTRKLNPDEFATLPAEAREKMLIEAAVLVRKIDAGEMSKEAVAALDKEPKAGGPTARMQIEGFFVQERQGNPELLSSLDNRITEMQQSGALAQDRQLAEFGGEVRASLAAQAEGGYSPIELTAQGKGPAPVEYTPPQAEAFRLGSMYDTDWNGKRYEPMPGVDTPWRDRQVPDGEQSAVALQMEVLAKRDPSEVTNAEMSEILNGMKGKTHDALDSRMVAATAETMIRAEGFIAAAAEGRFGSDNQALAKELAANELPQWRQYIADHYEHELMIPSREDAMLAQMRAAEAQWHAGVERGAAAVEATTPERNRDDPFGIEGQPKQAPAEVLAQATEVAPKLDYPERHLDDPFGLNAPAKPAASPAPAEALGTDAATRAAEVSPGKVEAAEVVKAEVLETAASKPAIEGAAESPVKAPDVAAPHQADAAESVATKPASEVTAESPAKGSEAQAAAPEAVPSGITKEAQQPTAESAPAIPKEAAPVIVSAQAQEETQTAIGRLSGTIQNPAGTLTTQDKQWDQKGIDRTAKAITRLDTNAVALMSPEERTKVHAVAQWVADNAAAGKLPGFASEKGQELLAKVQAKVAELAPLAEGSVDAATSKQLGKADNMVSAMDARERGITERLTPVPAQRAADEPEQTRSPGVPPAHTAKDLVDAIYSGKEMSEAYAKYLLKAGSQLEPADLKSLDPDTRARTAVALDQLAQAVKGGALGEFDTLSSAVQRHANAAGAAADKLFDAYKNDAEMKAPLARATMALSQDGSEASKSSAAKDAALDSAKDANKAKAAELER